MSETNQASTEGIMTKDPRIRAAVMFGQGKFNAGVIIEPVAEFQFDCGDVQKLAEFRNLIWYVVLSGNAKTRTSDFSCRDSVSRANEYAPHIQGFSRRFV